MGSSRIAAPPRADPISDLSRWRVVEIGVTHNRQRRHRVQTGFQAVGQAGGRARAPLTRSSFVSSNGSDTQHCRPARLAPRVQMPPPRPAGLDFPRSSAPPPGYATRSPQRSIPRRPALHAHRGPGRADTRMRRICWGISLCCGRSVIRPWPDRPFALIRIWISSRALTADTAVPPRTLNSRVARLCQPCGCRAGSCQNAYYTSRYSSNSNGCGREATSAASLSRLPSIQPWMNDSLKTAPFVRKA